MSVEITQQPRYRAEDLYAPAFSVVDKAELWGGELVILSPARFLHNRIAYRITKLFEEYCSQRSDLEFGGASEGFLIKRDPDVLLSPDACLFRRSQIGEDPWINGAPIVAVEVLSPSNSDTEMAQKRQYFFEGGAEQVWIVDPAQKRFQIYFADRRVLTADGGRVTGEGCVEGLSIDIDALLAEA